ncbi:MAG: replicative DNA helicase [Spirochaetaceae bacterium]|jgi:replicative DNA helicase|nr:replicative DNA helicase [Spirochaetaceae bacterium]
MSEELKERIPPHNDDAEKATLGAMLQDADAIITVSGILHGSDFYSNAHRRIYEAILALSNTGRPADIITVVEKLKEKNELDLAGGAAYISSLTNVVPAAVNVDYFATIVQNYSLRRSLIRISNRINLNSFDESQEPRLVVEDAQQKIFELAETGQTSAIKSLEEVIPEFIDVIEERKKMKKEGVLYSGVPAGIRGLDQCTSGFQKSQLVIIGARPSIGKTSLALSFASHAAIQEKKSVAFFTLEMPARDLAERLVAMETSLDASRLRNWTLKKSEIAQMMDGLGRLSEAKLYIVDMPNMNLLDLRTQARRLRSQYHVDIIFIDYIGLITLDNQSNYGARPRFEQVAEISRSLKSMARELNVPVVALSQLVREAEKNRPDLASLRDSGSVEQDADIIMFLHREREKLEDQSKDALETELILAKNRNGPTGFFKLMFVKNQTRYYEIEREHNA